MAVVFSASTGNRGCGPIEELMTYLLSNRQVKELVGRAAPITLALPRPPGEDRDWVRWAMAVLPAEFATYVQRAEERRIVVRPKLGVDAVDSLTTLLGEIVEPSTAWLCCQTLAIVVRLSVPHPRNAGSHKPQWPVDVSIGGERLFG